MDLLMFGLCLVVWVLCMSQANGDSETDQRYEDIRRSTLYGEIGSPENTTGLQRGPKNLLQDVVKKIGQKLVLPDQTFEVNSVVSNTDKQENESTKAFTAPPVISLVHTNKKYDYPVASKKALNFSKILTEISTENLQNIIPLKINSESKDNDEQVFRNDEDKSTVENITLKNNLSLSNERETNHLKYLTTPDGNERLIILLLRQPVPDRSVDKTLFLEAKNILLKDYLPKVQIENMNLFEILSPLSKDEVWLIDSIREAGVRAHLDQSGDSHTQLSLRKHNIPVINLKMQDSDHYTLEAILDLLSAKLSLPYVTRRISQPERIQYQQPKNKKYHSKNYFDYEDNVYNTEYKSKLLPTTTSDNEEQWQPAAGFHLVNYQTGPYGFVPTPKVNQLKYQFFDSDFPIPERRGTPRRSGFVRTFYNSKANN